MLPYQTSKVDHSKIYLVWSLIVFLNTLMPLFFAHEIVKGVSGYLGILMGVISFIIFYAQVDIFLIKKNYLALSRQLKLSAAVFRPLFYLLPMIDGVIGMAAIEIAKQITGITLDSNIVSDMEYSTYLTAQLNFIAVYTTTIINGALLTILVSCILLIARTFLWLIKVLSPH